MEVDGGVDEGEGEVRDLIEIMGGKEARVQINQPDLRTEEGGVGKGEELRDKVRATAIGSSS